jgi:hypothetical protein
MHALSSDSHFVRHGPCERCGSKDNVAWYSNGTGFCFGCGCFYKARGLHHVARHEGVPSETSRPNIRSVRSPPDDCNFEFPAVVLDWVSTYDLDAGDLIKYDVKWSQKREQLIYFFYGEDSREPLLWQSRNFRKGTAHANRFFTCGSPATTLAMYYPKQTTSTCVLVEDCISAIKVAMSGIGSGVPCFSAAMSASKLTQLSERYDNIVVWLDGDKFGEAVRISNRAKLLGCESKVINTSFDPKEYSLFEIQRNVT